MIRRMFRLLAVLVIGILAVDSYKILVYSPKFGHSHSNFIGRIADILVEAGHDVTTLVSVIDTKIGDGTKLSKIIRVMPNEESSRKWNEFTQGKANMFDVDVFSIIGANAMGEFFGSLLAAQCKVLLGEPGLIERLKKENYDVFFTENFDMCGIGLVEVIKPRSLISVAASTAFGPQMDEFGLPTALSYDPSHYTSSLNGHSMWDRMSNIYADFLVRLMFNHMRTKTHAVYKEKFGSSFPTMQQISSNSAYVFTNSEPLMDYAGPTISKVIPIGGIGAKEPSKLSEDWVQILSKREKTVLLSFGTIARSADLPPKVRNSIVETVKALPNVTFIWKYEEVDDFTRDVASKIPNLELTKWMPQSDLLAHPKLSAFITHGGMGSCMETALSGVPGAFIPLFGDQPRNAGMMEHNRLGKASNLLVLDKSEVTNSVKFVALIKEVLEDESYRANARRLSAMLRKRSFTAKEQLIKFTEFAAEFGPSKALRPQSYDMNWIEYNNVDIIFAGLIVSLILILVFLKMMQLLISRIVFVSKTKEE